jgi:hypothetical protein
LTEESIAQFLLSIARPKRGECHHFEEVFVLVLRMDYKLEIVNAVLTLLLLYLTKRLKIIGFNFGHSVDHLTRLCP